MKRSKIITLIVICVLTGASLTGCDGADQNLYTGISNSNHSALAGTQDPNNPGGVIVSIPDVSSSIEYFGW